MKKNTLYNYFTSSVLGKFSIKEKFKTHIIAILSEEVNSKTKLKNIRLALDLLNQRKDVIHIPHEVRMHIDL